MIDFHSHILPKIDDGSSSSDMSLEMVKASFKCGIDVMVATPHFYIKQNTVDKFIAHRHGSYNALMHKIEQSCSSEVVPDIRLGAEVYYFPSIQTHPDIHKLCIENTDYLLLEMPFEPWTARMITDVETLMFDCKIKPIIAHLDRYFAFQKHNNRIKELLSLGVNVQINGDFVNGFLTKNKALSLLKDGTADLLGSDCHNMTKRAPNLGKSFDIIRSKCGDAVLERIDKCGRSILGI